MAARAAPTQQVPGAEFLEKRLQRAAATPADQRSPEVAAFLEGAQLCREVCRLLPLTAAGQPALQRSSPAAEPQVLCAFALYARAVWLCPCRPISDVPLMKHLAAYMEWEWQNIEERATHEELGRAGGRGRDLAELAQPLLALVQLGLNPPSSIYATMVGLVADEAALLHNPSSGRQVSRALEQLAASTAHLQLPLALGTGADSQAAQPLALATTQQVLVGLDCGLVTLVGALETVQVEDPLLAAMGVQCQPSSPAELAAAAAAKAAAARRLLALEPDNPRSHFMAAMAAASPPHKLHRAGEVDRSILQAQAASARLFLRAYQLARQQGSDFWAIQAASCAIKPATEAFPLGAEAAVLIRQSLEAVEAAAPAFRSCKRVLPEPWVKNLQADLDPAQQLVPGAQAMLRTAQQMATSRTWTDSHMGLADSAVFLGGLEALTTSERGVQEALAAGPTNKCDSCGASAVGVKRCSACKRVQYCSRECQLADWKARHKKVCSGRQQK